jgi:hypothetical protein
VAVGTTVGEAVPVAWTVGEAAARGVPLAAGVDTRGASSRPLRGPSGLTSVGRAMGLVAGRGVAAAAGDRLGGGEAGRLATVALASAVGEALVGLAADVGATPSVGVGTAGGAAARDGVGVVEAAGNSDSARAAVSATGVLAARPGAAVGIRAVWVETVLAKRSKKVSGVGVGS